MCPPGAPDPPPSMNDIKKRLSRTLSGPRRCPKCQKMVYLALSRCKFCDELTHKHCLYHSNKFCAVNAQDRPDETYSPSIKSDTTEWRPVFFFDRNGAISPGSCDAEEAFQSELRHPNPGVALAGILKLVHWLCSHGPRAKRTRSSRNCEKHYKGRYGLKMDEKEARKMFKIVLKNSRNCQKQANSLGGPHQPNHAIQKEVQRMNKRPAPVEDLSSPRSSVSSRSDGSFLSPFGSPEVKTLRQKRDKMARQASIKWDKDVYNAANDPDAGFSLCTNYHPSERSKLNSVSPKPSLRPKEKGWSSPGNPHGVSNHQKFLLDFGPKTATIAFAKPPGLTKAKTLSVESRDHKNESLCATWPPVGKGGTLIEEIVDETVADCIEETDESFNFSDFRSDSQNGEESLKEWYIPFGDIEFHERIRQGRNGDIYKGRWYGEVLIYTIRDSEGEGFLEEVARMGMIRHENIVLFMGACIEPNRLAVVTSMRKGPTLFEYLHLKRHRLPFHSKHNIARQIAQGMGYLHAKDIVHKKLNSKNIILECRVKLCIMDHGMADKQMDRLDCGCIPRGQLSYLSPELMSSLQLQPPNIFASRPCTQASDIFAFGSLLYELLCERFVYYDQPPHAVIWQIGAGKMPPLHNFRFINGLKVLIKRCWSSAPQQRPPFSEIFHILQENISHHRRHSCSEPDRLHLTGQTCNRTLCT